MNFSIPKFHSLVSKLFVTGFIFINLFYTLEVKAQKLELHYDFLPNREYFTTTLTDFKMDSLGNTFYFIDFDFNNRENGKSVSATYFEIAREFNLNKLGLGGLRAHIEYNDGFAITPNNVGSNPIGFPYSRALLIGLGYSFSIKGFDLNTYLAYKAASDSDNKDAQFTVSWFEMYFNGKLTFSGFMDVWTQNFNGKRRAVFIAEPQLWFNLNKSFSLGSEVELAKNIDPSTTDFTVYPTVAIKWAF
jgi:hypothetical protein